MSAEYNSKLLDKLYEEVNENKAIEIGDEMVEIADPIFIQPLYSAYKKFRRTTSSHFFLSDLQMFKTPETTEIFKIISNENNIKDTDFLYCLWYFNDIEHIETSINLYAFELFSKKINTDLDDYDLNIFYKYLSRIKPTLPLAGFLKVIFENEDNTKAVRTVALQFFLRENAKENLKYYYDNFDKIKGTKAEIILTKEIVDWKGGIIPDFKEKILKEGSSRAKEIIESSNKQEKKKTQEKENNIEIKYNNAQIITEIAKIRSKINIVTNGDTRFGFSIFPPTELLYQQTEAPSDKQKFVGYCIDLRSFIQELDTENLSKHGFSTEEMKEKIREIENLKGSLNLLNIYLLSKEINVPKDLFGLRKINKVLAKLAHPEQDKDLSTLLKENNLLGFYKDSNFSALHRKLLEKYKEFLINFLESLGKTSGK